MIRSIASDELEWFLATSYEFLGHSDPRAFAGRSVRALRDPVLEADRSFILFAEGDVPLAGAYVAAHLAHPSFRRWRAMGLVDGADQPFYARDLPRRPWPGPAPLAARAVAAGTPENDACPYSGRAPTRLMEAEGRTWGFCNAFCRDKTVADPLAWPAFAALLGR